MGEVTTAVLPVAGRGTRFMPYTKGVPKEMLALLDRPVIHHVVEECVRAGVRDVVLVTSPQKPSIEQYFTRDPELASDLEAGGRRHLIDELTRLTDETALRFLPQIDVRGSGAAVLSAADIVSDEHFLLLWGDEIVVGEVDRSHQLLDAHAACGGPVVGMQHVESHAVSNYGVAALGEEVRPGLWQLRDIVEKPALNEAPSSYAALGGYVMAPEIIDCLHELVAENPSGEVHLTDALRRMLERAPVYGVLLDGHYLDVGSPDRYLRSHIEFALHDETVGPALAEFLGRLVNRDVEAS